LFCIRNSECCIRNSGVWVWGLSLADFDWVRKIALPQTVLLEGALGKSRPLVPATTTAAVIECEVTAGTLSGVTTALVTGCDDKQK